ncbi:hypothetical protein [Corynebacterium glucuronolyticum]|uniref:Uncharacterized protein n=2 Tax=Corynebacterium glucuronolyticum TaxID=39791 RepID=A0AAX1L6H9_9CORY|nr:hypothetical protein [Corynebacterium glucuronolyticum]QRP70021.1 hypothetical protein I6J21_09545 [Corynebacterium glucuronolyticum]
MIRGVRVLVVRMGGTGSSVWGKGGNFPFPTGEVNRRQWWQRNGTDVSASVVRPETVECVRCLVSEMRERDGDEMLDDGDLLTHIGVVTPVGALTDVGVYALAPTTEPRFWANSRCIGGRRMIDQMAQVEEILSDLNAPVEWGVGGLSITASPVPESAVRNALVYALIANKYHHMLEISLKYSALVFRVRLQRAREPRPVGSPPCAGNR